MRKYIDRLINCGYSFENALKICQDFQKNLNLVDLENFILSIEKEKCGKNITQIQPVEM